MSELNKKNINYGNLNRFYQNLKNKDLKGKLVLNGTADLNYNQDMSLSTIENVEIDGDVDITTLDSADVKFMFTLKISGTEIANMEATGTYNRYTLISQAMSISVTDCRFTFPFMNMTTRNQDMLIIDYDTDSQNWTAKLMFASQSQSIME